MIQATEQGKIMDVYGDSSFAAAGHQPEVWSKIEASLQTIQTHCNQVLSYYPQLPPHEIIDLIEVIEIQNFLLQELLAQVAPSSSTIDSEK